MKDRSKNLILVIYAKSFWSIPINHFLFSKTSWRRLEDVFSVTIRLRLLPRSPQDVVKTCLQDVFASTSWRRLERQKLLHLRRLEHVLNTSSLRRMFADLLWYTWKHWIKAKNCNVVINKSCKTECRYWKIILDSKTFRKVWC